MNSDLVRVDSRVHPADSAGPDWKGVRGAHRSRRNVLPKHDGQNVCTRGNANIDIKNVTNRDFYAAFVISFL